MSTKIYKKTTTKARSMASAHGALGPDLHALGDHCVGLRCKVQVSLFGRHARGLASLTDYLSTLQGDSAFGAKPSVQFRSCTAAKAGTTTESLGKSCTGQKGS